MASFNSSSSSYLSKNDNNMASSLNIISFNVSLPSSLIVFST
jgi:hypothetical protein